MKYVLFFILFYNLGLAQNGNGIYSQLDTIYTYGNVDTIEVGNSAIFEPVNLPCNKVAYYPNIHPNDQSSPAKTDTFQCTLIISNKTKENECIYSRRGIFIEKNKGTSFYGHELGITEIEYRNKDFSQIDTAKETVIMHRVN